MPHVGFAPDALRDSQRLYESLRPNNPVAAQQVAAVITKAVRRLRQHPQMEKPVGDMEPDHRELLIGFGNSDYVALYRLNDGLVTVLALCHQTESGMKN